MRCQRTVVGLIAVVVAMGISGCDPGGQPDAAGRSSEPPAPVIAPGKPGESASLLPSGSRPKEVPPNDADFHYVQQMIPHHQQALEMTALAPERVANEQVRSLAARISGAQGPEIGAMTAYLKRHNKSPEHHGHDAGSMPGMATPQQLAALKAAKGADFDKLFLQLMITHHEGAVTMAKQRLGGGVDVLVEEMAQDVIATQTNEIGKMKAMLAG